MIKQGYICVSMEYKRMVVLFYDDTAQTQMKFEMLEGRAPTRFLNQITIDE